MVAQSLQTSTGSTYPMRERGLRSQQSPHTTSPQRRQWCYISGGGGGSDTKARGMEPEQHQKSFHLLNSNPYPMAWCYSRFLVLFFPFDPVSDIADWMLAHAICFGFCLTALEKNRKLQNKIRNEKLQFEANWMLLTYSSVCEGEGRLALVTLRALQWEGTTLLIGKERDRGTFSAKWLGLASQTQPIPLTTVRCYPNAIQSFIWWGCG